MVFKGVKYLSYISYLYIYSNTLTYDQIIQVKQFHTPNHMRTHTRIYNLNLIVVTF